MRVFLVAFFVATLALVQPVAAISTERSKPDVIDAKERVATDAPPSVEMVAAGLDNPRGLAISSTGSIYVAESGTGGALLVESAEGANCVGDTGAVSKIRGGEVSVVASFASVAEANDADGPGPGAPTCEGAGIAAGGPSGVAVEATGDVVVAMALGGTPETRAQFPAAIGDQLGTLQRIDRNGDVEKVADLASFEAERDPDGRGADSNPYAVVALDYGRRLVADAGGNDILEINPWGGVRRYVSAFPKLPPAEFTPPSCFADLPPEAQAEAPPPGAMIPPDPVPTSVAVGPDGAYYVGMLSGFPFAAGAAAVYRVDPATGRHDPYVSGLNHVVGIGFGPDGTLFVVELVENLLELEVCETPAPGALLMVKDGVTTVLLDDVPLPGGLVVDAYGAVYLTTNSIFPGAGEVWKVTPAE